MSAFVVGNDLLDLLVTAAISGPPYARDLRVWHGDGPGETGCTPWVWATDQDGATLGQMWHDMNVASVNFRYAEGVAPGVYRFRRVSDLGGVAATYWDVINGAACLDYQCCELPGWDQSLARAALMAVRDKALDRLMPEGAAWEWSREEGARRRDAVRDSLRNGGRS